MAGHAEDRGPAAVGGLDLRRILSPGVRRESVTMEVACHDLLIVIHIRADGNSHILGIDGTTDEHPTAHIQGIAGRADTDEYCRSKVVQPVRYREAKVPVACCRYRMTGV